MDGVLGVRPSRRAGEWEIVEQRLVWMKPIAIQSESLVDRALIPLLQGKILDAKSTEAKTQLDQAVLGLERAGRIGEVPLGWLARARLRRQRHQYAKAEQDIAEAQQLAARCGMTLHLTDAHLERARLLASQGRKEQALVDVRIAERLVAETGYHRRDGELTELRRDVQ